MSDTIAAIATGAQISAIGIVRISGERSIEIVDRLFTPSNGKRMSECESRKLVYGRLSNAQGELLDLCLCTISRAPRAKISSRAARRTTGEPWHCSSAVSSPV